MVNILNELVKGNTKTEGKEDAGDKTEDTENKVDNVDNADEKTEDVTTD